MRYSLLLSPFLAASALAAPGSLCKKGACNADNCLRAVRATNAKPYASSASADCSSFMRKTVTPCPVTSTSTATVTATDSPATVTATAIENDTQFFTVTNAVTSVLTIEDTATVVQVSTAIVTQVVQTTVTATTAAQTTTAAPGTTIVYITERSAPTGAKKARSAGTMTTSAGTCAATTNAPTAVPTYASACSGISRYSSACSCAGVTGGTTTLTASTVVTTTTSTVHVTPTSTVTATVTNIASLTAVATTVVPATFETTDATILIPSAVTLTNTVLVPTTVVPAAPACTVYNFLATNGIFAGRFLESVAPEGDDYGENYFVDDPSTASTFTRNDAGVIYSHNGAYGWVAPYGSYNVIYSVSDATYLASGDGHINCNIGNGDTSYPGAVGTVTCNSYGQSLDLTYCTEAFGVRLIKIGVGEETTYDCTNANVVAIPAC